MTEVTFNKQMQSAYNRYLHSRYYNNIYNCYAKPSFYKIKALEYCNDLCRQLKGYDLKIIGYNCMQFSVGFHFEKNDCLYFAYITKDYNKFCKILWHIKGIFEIAKNFYKNDFYLYNYFYKIFPFIKPIFTFLYTSLYFLVYKYIYIYIYTLYIPYAYMNSTNNFFQKFCKNVKIR